MRKKRWTGMGSADSYLPFQDWRWLVTRRGADEKPIVAAFRVLVARLPRQSIKQCMTWRCKRTDDSDPAPCEAVLQIFRDQQPTTSLRGRGENDRVPNAESVIGSQISGHHHHILCRRGNGECVAPAQKGIPCLHGRSSCLADQNVEQFTKNLNRNNGAILPDIAQQFENDVALLRTVHPFRVSKDIGIERDLQCSSS